MLADEYFHLVEAFRKYIRSLLSAFFGSFPHRSGVLAEVRRERLDRLQDAIIRVHRWFPKE